VTCAVVQQALWNGSTRKITSARLGLLQERTVVVETDIRLFEPPFAHLVEEFGTGGLHNRAKFMAHRPPARVLTISPEGQAATARTRIMEKGTAARPHHRRTAHHPSA